jgi:hypothetical protein
MEKTMLAGFDQHWAASTQDDGFIGSSRWRGDRLHVVGVTTDCLEGQYAIQFLARHH